MLSLTKMTTQMTTLEKTRRTMKRTKTRKRKKWKKSITMKLHPCTSSKAPRFRRKPKPAASHGSRSRSDGLRFLSHYEGNWKYCGVGAWQSPSHTTIIFHSGPSIPCYNVLLNVIEYVDVTLVPRPQSENVLR